MQMKRIVVLIVAVRTLDIESWRGLGYAQWCTYPHSLALDFLSGQVVDVCSDSLGLYGFISFCHEYEYPPSRRRHKRQLRLLRVSPLLRAPPLIVEPRYSCVYSFTARPRYPGINHTAGKLIVGDNIPVPNRASAYRSRRLSNTSPR